MVSLLVAAVLFVVAVVIFNVILSVSATRRVLGRTSHTEPGSATGAVLMASDYGDDWQARDRDGGSSGGGYFGGADCDTSSDAGGGDCGGDGGGGGAD